MQHDKFGNVIPEEIIESDRKFYSVPVVITSTIWESGIHIYEADSPEEALEKYLSEHSKDTPLDIDYTGWQDQEYRYDELDDHQDVELMENERADIQWLLKREQEAKDANE